MDEWTGVESSYLMQNLTVSERRLLLTCFREESWKAGKYVFEENDVGDTLYIAESGVVSMRCWITVAGMEKTLLTVGRGGVFGEMSFMDRKGRSASAFVEEDAVLHVLSRPDFDEFSKKYPAAGAKVLDSLLCIVVERLRLMNEAYGEALERGLHMIGADQLNFHHLITQHMRIRLALVSGQTVDGTITKVEQSNAGHEVIVRSASGKLIMVPYHAISTIAFDIEGPETVDRDGGRKP